MLQLNAHIDNITIIAKGIPTPVVIDRMYSVLIPDVLTSQDSMDSSDQLKMIAAVHRVVPAQISYDAVAQTLLTILVQSKDPAGQKNRDDRKRRMKRLRCVLRLLASELSPNFDACALMNAFFSFNVSVEHWSREDEEDKARLMFICILMQLSFPVGLAGAENTKARSNGTNGQATASMSSARSSVLAAREILLRWCCTEYGPRFAPNRIQKDADDNCGAGTPDFRSVLGPTGLDEKMPSWLKTMRCLLFVEEPDSSLMKTFLGLSSSDDDDDVEWMQLMPSVRLCYEKGVDLTDNILWIVVKACAKKRLGSDVAITLLEHLFRCCSKDRAGDMVLTDPTTAWELFNLTQYVHSERSVKLQELLQRDAEDEPAR